jgi:hypothetical protein
VDVGRISLGIGAEMMLGCVIARFVVGAAFAFWLIFGWPKVSITRATKTTA